MSDKPTKHYDFGSQLESIKSVDWNQHKSKTDSKSDENLDAVRKIAESNGFTSREPKSEPLKEFESQITIRGKQSVIEEFRKFAANQEPKWPLGYTLERAFAALKKELG